MGEKESLKNDDLNWSARKTFVFLFCYDRIQIHTYEKEYVIPAFELIDPVALI